jgi:hypothetical protein
MYLQDTQPRAGLSDAPARSLPEVKYCDPKLWGDVFTHWRLAVDAVKKINERLTLIKNSTNRIDFWNSGPEKIWFGNFSFAHFEQLQRNMQQIHDILRDPKLTIVCDEGLKHYGWSVPGFRRIKLGCLWKCAWLAAERTQTLIHEAAHIAWVVDLAEGRKSGAECAKKLAQQNCFKAMRNADNYGYYALHFIGAYQNASPDNCKKNYPIRAC